MLVAVVATAAAVAVMLLVLMLQVLILVLIYQCYHLSSAQLHLSENISRQLLCAVHRSCQLTTENVLVVTVEAALAVYFVNVKSH